MTPDQNQLLENWEKEFDKNFERGHNHRKGENFIVSDSENMLSSLDDVKLFLKTLLKLQEAKTKEECAKIVASLMIPENEYNEESDREYSRQSALQEAQQQILDLNNKKDE